MGEFLKHTVVPKKFSQNDLTPVLQEKMLWLIFALFLSWSPLKLHACESQMSMSFSHCPLKEWIKNPPLWQLSSLISGVCFHFIGQLILQMVRGRWTFTTGHKSTQLITDMAKSCLGSFSSLPAFLTQHGQGKQLYSIPGKPGVPELYLLNPVSLMFKSRARGFCLLLLFIKFEITPRKGIDLVSDVLVVSFSPRQRVNSVLQIGGHFIALWWQGLCFHAVYNI